MLFSHAFFCDDADDNDDNDNDNATISQIFLSRRFRKMRASSRIPETAICKQKIAISDKILSSDNFDNDDNHDQGVL